VRYRIKRLETEGIIAAYNGLIDFRVLGFNSIRMYFKFRNCTPEIENEMYEEMKRNDLFLWTVNLEGEIDLAFYMWVKELDQFYEKWESFFLKYRKYIYKQEFYLSINMIHYPLKYIKMPEFVEVWDIGKNKKRHKIDAIDLKILQLLSRQANLPLIDIAKKVDISAKLVSYRIKILEKKKIILAYNAIIDEKKIGYHMYKVDFYLFDHSRLIEMYEFARQHPNIKNVMKTMGGPDFEIEPFVRSIDELRALIDEFRSTFAESIDHWRFNRIVKTIKQVYLPIDIDLEENQV
jgi:DNA-binding Lrp family transcriptional regulator